MADSYTFKGAINFEEYVEICKAMTAKRRLWSLWITLLCGALLFAGALVYRAHFNDGKFLFLAGFVVLYGCVIAPCWFRFRVSYAWNRYPVIKADLEMTVTADGVDTKDAFGEQFHTPWRSFLRFRETDLLFILYLAPPMQCILPKRLLAEGDHAAVRQILSVVNAPKPPGEPLA